MTSVDCVRLHLYINNFSTIFIFLPLALSFGGLLRAGTDRAGQRFGAEVRESVAAMQ